MNIIYAQFNVLSISQLNFTSPAQFNVQPLTQFNVISIPQFNGISTAQFNVLPITQSNIYHSSPMYELDKIINNYSFQF